MKRNATVDVGDNPHERPDLRLIVDVAGRRLVYAENDLKTLGFGGRDL